MKFGTRNALVWGIGATILCIGSPALAGPVVTELADLPSSTTRQVSSVYVSELMREPLTVNESMTLQSPSTSDDAADPFLAVLADATGRDVAARFQSLGDPDGSSTAFEPIQLVSSAGSFDLRQQPLIPLPPAAWTGVSALVGLALIQGNRRFARIFR